MEDLKAISNAILKYKAGIKEPTTMLADEIHTVIQEVEKRKNERITLNLPEVLQIKEYLENQKFKEVEHLISFIDRSILEHHAK